MLRNIALGKRKEIEAKDTWALEMDLDLGMGGSRANLRLYNPSIQDRDGIAVLKMRDDPN